MSSRTREIVALILMWFVAIITGIAIQHAFDVLPTDKRRNFHFVEELPKPVPCPEDPLVILAVGQSNAANYASERRSAPAFAFYDGNCYPASDPLPGAAGDIGSIWTRMVPLLKTDQPVIFAVVAINGAKMEELSPGGVFYDKIRLAIVQLERRGLEPKFSLVVQGEADQVRNTVPDDYQVFATKLLKALPGQTYMALVTRCGSTSDLLREAQRLAIQDSGADLGPDLDSVKSRIDGCHFDRDGAERAAGLWADVLNKDLT